MRDLHAVEPRAPLTATVEGDPDSTGIDQQIRTVRREQKIAGLAVMLLDTAKVLEPVVELLSQRALAWFAVLASTGLAAYALTHPSWERGAILAGFMILISFVVRVSR